MYQLPYLPELFIAQKNFRIIKAVFRGNLAVSYTSYKVIIFSFPVIRVKPVTGCLPRLGMTGGVILICGLGCTRLIFQVIRRYIQACDVRTYSQLRTPYRLVVKHVRYSVVHSGGKSGSIRCLSFIGYMCDFFSRRQRKESNFIALPARAKKSHVYQFCNLTPPCQVKRFSSAGWLAD